MNNGNGFLAPALGIHLWTRIWLDKYPMDSKPWHTQPSKNARNWQPGGDSATERYYRQLDNGMRWQPSFEQVRATLQTFVLPDGPGGYVSTDRVTAVRRIFDEYSPGARVLSQVPERHWPDILRQVQELQS